MWKGPVVPAETVAFVLEGFAGSFPALTVSSAGVVRILDVP